MGEQEGAGLAEGVPEVGQVWLLGEQPQGSAGSSSSTQSPARAAPGDPLKLEGKGGFHPVFGAAWMRLSCLSGLQ